MFIDSINYYLLLVRFYMEQVGTVLLHSKNRVYFVVE